MKPAIRLAALMRIPSMFIFTHDSIGLGEDGPTHQPVEHVMALRLIPGLTVLRPADANETAVAWEIALSQKTPSALVLTRQNLPILAEYAARIAGEARRGGYILQEAANTQPECILIASGSEVALALAAAGRLAERGVATRVVSLLSWELFSRQELAYQQQVIPPEHPGRFAMEAGSPLGWERWTGSASRVIALERFGASAPGEIVMARLGFSPEQVVERVMQGLAAR
jgi:transketolase